MDLYTCDYCGVQGDGEEWYFATDYGVNSTFKLCVDCSLEVIEEFSE